MKKDEGWSFRLAHVQILMVSLYCDPQSSKTRLSLEATVAEGKFQLQPSTASARL